jgi:hypothetical protein
MVALGVALAFAVRKHVGKPKPPVKRRASSIAAHFARMNSSPNDIYDPSRPESQSGQFELHQCNWETA